MPFQVGNTYGGKRENSGRPPKIKKEIEKAAAEIAREFINRSVKPVMATYFQLAHGRIVNKWHEGEIVGKEFEADAATTRHFVDKLLPDEQAHQIPSLTVNFNHYHNSVSLHASGLPGAVLGGNGKGRKEGVEGVASEIGQGQNGLEFHHFEDVS